MGTTFTKEEKNLETTMPSTPEEQDKNEKRKSSSHKSRSSSSFKPSKSSSSSKSKSKRTSKVRTTKRSSVKRTADTPGPETRLSHRVSVRSSKEPREPCAEFNQDAIYGTLAVCGDCQFPREQHKGRGQSHDIASLAHGTFRRIQTSTGLHNHPAYPATPGFTFRRWRLRDESYKPVEFTHPVVLEFDRTVKAGGWADPVDPLSIHTEIAARHSFTGELTINKQGRPINPTGRTGFTGRGLLGKWGPNKAADAIVSRRTKDGKLEIVVIERKDTKQWALPGGMVDDGEAVAVACKREFIEEAGNVEESKRESMLQQIDELFDSDNAQAIYQGYVEDPRNTDNAWMESSFFHFPCPSKLAKSLFLTAGDDASDVKWLVADENEEEFKNMYADHRKRVMQAVVEAFRIA